MLRATLFALPTSRGFASSTALSSSVAIAWNKLSTFLPSLMDK